MSFNPRTHTGCDYVESYKTFLNERFQSTHPHGVRHLLRVPGRHLGQVSIHAPTRGATSPTLPNNIASLVSIHAPTRGATSYGLGSLSPRLFQSTHPHGVRQATTIAFSTLQGFQSTHPHGVRLTDMSGRSTHPCFNPRTHTGCDRRLT